MSIIHHKHSLKKHNSFGVEVQSSHFANPSTLNELQEILESYDYLQKAFLVMGEGSNLLFTKDFNGLVVKPCIKGIELLEENKSNVLVKVGAGENWDGWVEYATGKRPRRTQTGKRFSTWGAFYGVTARPRPES